MAKSSKLVVARNGRVLLVRRRRDKRWMFPGGRRRAGESERKCLHREIMEELPKLRLGELRLWKEVNGKNRRSGRRMSDAIFLSKKGLRSPQDRRQEGARPGGMAKAARAQADVDLPLHSRQAVSEIGRVPGRPLCGVERGSLTRCAREHAPGGDLRRELFDRLALLHRGSADQGKGGRFGERMRMHHLENGGEHDTA